MRQIAKSEETDDGQHAHHEPTRNFTDGVVVLLCVSPRLHLILAPSRSSSFQQEELGQEFLFSWYSRLVLYLILRHSSQEELVLDSSILYRIALKST